MDERLARRASQFCRVLGNPLAYRIVRLLDGARRRPKDLARALNVSPTAVVNQLKHLKLMGVVRFRSSGVRRAGRLVEYWLADRTLNRRLREIERSVGRLS